MKILSKTYKEGLYEKKVLSMMLVGVLAVSAFAACGSNGASDAATGSTDGEETTVDTASEDENTLSVAAWDKNFNIPALEAAEKAYQKNPDFKLIIQEQSQSSDVEDKVTLAGSSDDYSQLPDIVLFQDHYIKKYVTDYPNAWQSLEDADIMEAARIDGLNEFAIFFRMYLPVMRSTYAAAAVITFMNAWNAYLWPKVVMNSDTARTMPMLIANLASGYTTDYGVLMMGVLFCSIPTMVIFFVLQKQFAEGITGAVK